MEEEDNKEENFSEQEKVIEERHLRQQLCRMREEYSELLHTHEDQVTRLTKDLDHGQKKVDSSEKDLKKCCDMLEEKKAMKQSYEKLEEVNVCLKVKEEKNAEDTL